MNRVKLVIWIFFAFFIIQSCNRGGKKEAEADTPSSGTVKIAVDESLQPIFDEELSVFKYLNPKANPELIYKPENGALRLLLNDSARVIVLSRDLDTSEVKIISAKNLVPRINQFAIDAVALIVNQTSNDTLITVNEIKKMLAGQAKTEKNIVFDNANSSLSRY